MSDETVSPEAERPEPTSTGRVDLSTLTDTDQPGLERSEGEEGTAPVPEGYPQDPDDGPLGGREDQSERDLGSPGNPIRHHEQD